MPPIPFGQHENIHSISILGVGLVVISISPASAQSIRREITPPSQTFGYRPQSPQAFPRQQLQSRRLLQKNHGPLLQFRAGRRGRAR
jgi:hypothetical protein